MSHLKLKLSTQIYNEREAWGFLQSHGPELTCSIRTLASIWKWHRSKVERFLKVLRAESLIETGIKSGKTLITIRQNRDDYGDKDEMLVEQINSRINEITDPIARQTQDNFADSFPDSFLAISNHKEEKKKRSKKRKEEIKEKTPLKGGKKEKKSLENKAFSRDQEIQPESQLECQLEVQSDSQNENQVLEEILYRLPKNQPTSVVAEDVIDWAEKNLPTRIDIDWELEKFKDYYRSNPKKPPKNADFVAAFRNWLRRAVEFNNSKLQNKNLGGLNHEYYNNNTTRESSFERFFTGGLRALDDITGSGLEWQIDREM